MKKIWILFSVFILLVLPACNADVGWLPLKTAPAAVATSTVPPTAIIPTATPVNTLPPALPPLPTSEPVTCAASSLLPTPSAAEASLFPPVSAQDWKLGPDGAAVVITEYSDFT